MTDSPPELGLDIEAPLLWEDEEVTVVVAERAVAHRGVRGVDVHGKALAQGGVTISGDRLQTGDEVRLCALRRDVERMPRQLGGAEVYLGIEREEAGLQLCALVRSSQGANEAILTSGLSGRRVKPLCATEGRMRYIQLYMKGHVLRGLRLSHVPMLTLTGCPSEASQRECH